MLSPDEIIQIETGLRVPSENRAHGRYLVYLEALNKAMYDTCYRGTGRMSSMKRVEVVAYNPAWPEQFETERARMVGALQENCAAIHHVGSTAVPGLAAKPRIDMIVVTKDPKAAVPVLEQLGFEYMGEYNIPLHYGFRKRGDVEYNLHMYPEAHPEIELNLTFRDYLRTHPEVRDAYATLKQELAHIESSGVPSALGLKQYTLQKGPFIREVLRKAGFDRVRIVRPSDETEWAEARKFRREYFTAASQSDDTCEGMISHKNHEHFLLYRGTEVVGYTHLQMLPAQRVAMVCMMWIDNPARNRGLGRAMVEKIEQWLVNHGYTVACVDASTCAVGFYERCGYHQGEDSRFAGYQPRLEHVLLQKRLS